MVFDEKKYTPDAILEELALMERHTRDGSALNAGCACIEEKHTLLLSGLSSEKVLMTDNPKEKEFYLKLGEFAKKARHEIIDASFNFPTNPTSGECPKLIRCYEKVSKTCVMPACNPYAVCRASVKCP